MQEQSRVLCCLVLSAAIQHIRRILRAFAPWSDLRMTMVRLLHLAAAEKNKNSKDSYDVKYLSRVNSGKRVCIRSGGWRDPKLVSEHILSVRSSMMTLSAARSIDIASALQSVSLHWTLIKRKKAFIYFSFSFLLITTLSYRIHIVDWHIFSYSVRSR